MHILYNPEQRTNMEVFYREGVEWEPAEVYYQNAAPEWLKQGFLMGNIPALNDGLVYSEGDRAFYPTGGHYYALRYKLQLGLDNGKLKTPTAVGYSNWTQLPLRQLGDISWSDISQLVPSGNTTNVIRNGKAQSEGYFSLRGSSTDTIEVSVMGDSFIMAKVNIFGGGEWKDSNVGFDRFYTTDFEERISYIANNDLNHTANFNSFKSIEDSWFTDRGTNIDGKDIEILHSTFDFLGLEAEKKLSIVDSCILCNNKIIVKEDSYIRNVIGKLNGWVYEEPLELEKLELENFNTGAPLGFGGLGIEKHQNIKRLKIENANFLGLVSYFHEIAGNPQELSFDLHIINDEGSPAALHKNGMLSLALWSGGPGAYYCRRLHIKLIFRNCRFHTGTGGGTPNVSIKLPADVVSGAMNEILIEDEDFMYPDPTTPTGISYEPDGSTRGGGVLEEYQIPTNALDAAVAVEEGTDPLIDKLDLWTEHDKLFSGPSGSKTINNGAKNLRYGGTTTPGDNPCKPEEEE